MGILQFSVDFIFMTIISEKMYALNYIHFQFNSIQFYSGIRSIQNTFIEIFITDIVLK